MPLHRSKHRGGLKGYYVLCTKRQGCLYKFYKYNALNNQGFECHKSQGFYSIQENRKQGHCEQQHFDFFMNGSI